MILLAENTDMVIEKIERHLSKQKYRMLIIPVEATVPRMEEEKEKEEEKREEEHRGDLSGYRGFRLSFKNIFGSGNTGFHSGSNRHTL